MEQIKTAMLGGSFDPVHKGHLFLLHSAVSYSDYQRIILVPASLSNFKRNASPVANDSERLEMLELAVQDYRDMYPQDKAEIIISDIELKRGGISYTSDTVKALKQQYGIEGRLGLIIGDDHIKTLSNWHEFDYLKKEVEYLVCKRYEKDMVFETIDKDIVYRKLETYVTSPESSSAVRNNIEKNIGYLSERVAKYAKLHRLYS